MIITACFTQEFFDRLESVIKTVGPKLAEEALIEMGYQRAFIRAAMRRILRTRGW